MSGLPPYYSSPEARELWEITGALAEEQYLRDVYEGRILSCDHCFERENEGFPWTCPDNCPNKKGQLEWKEIDAEIDFGLFMCLIDSELKTLGESE